MFLKETTDVLIEIYEAEMNGDISKAERDYLIMEMKSRMEYRERKLKKDLNYDKETKTITVNGKKHGFSRDDKTWVANNGVGPFGDEITYSKELLKLKHPKSSKFVIHHEIAHKEERDYWDGIYSNIMDDVDRYIDSIKNDSDKREKIQKIVDSYYYYPSTSSKDTPRTVHVLIRKLTDAGVPNLNKYNSEIRDFDKNVVTKTYKKYDVKNKHGRTLEEYHADLRSADSVGSKVAKTALSDLEKINRKDAKKNNANCGENTKEMIARRKVIGQNAKMRAKESMKK